MNITRRPQSSSVNTPPQPPLRVCVERALNDYLSNLEGQQTTGLYSIVLAEMELPLLKVILKHTHYNKRQAATVLGLSRNTLRKKLKQYHITSDETRTPI